MGIRHAANPRDHTRRRPSVRQQVDLPPECCCDQCRQPQQRSRKQHTQPNRQGSVLSIARMAHRGGLATLVNVVCKRCAVNEDLTLIAGEIGLCGKLARQLDLPVRGRSAWIGAIGGSCASDVYSGTNQRLSGASTICPEGCNGRMFCGNSREMHSAMAKLTKKWMKTIWAITLVANFADGQQRSGGGDLIDQLVSQEMAARTRHFRI